MTTFFNTVFQNPCEFEMQFPYFAGSSAAERCDDDDGGG